MSDGHQEMGFSCATAPMHINGIECRKLERGLIEGTRFRINAAKFAKKFMRKKVFRSHHKMFKGAIRIELIKSERKFQLGWRYNRSFFFSLGFDGFFRFGVGKAKMNLHPFIVIIEKFGL